MADIPSITFPQLLPAIVAGFLLSSFSFDDFVIATFVSGGLLDIAAVHLGPDEARRDAETNAVAAMILAFTLAMLFIGQLALTWQNRRRGRQGGGMSEMIAQQQGG